MANNKQKKIKSELHPRNRNRERYDLHALAAAIPELESYIMKNKHGIETINFSDPIAVRLLNQGLLKHYYGIENWDLPEKNLCPPIPGRADYIHYAADLLAECNKGKIPTGNKIICLDIGVGASCIYPIIGVTEYGWNFIGSDVDRRTIESAQNIVDSNPSLKNKIDIRFQKNKRSLFDGVIENGEKIDISICNPPFHASIAEAKQATRRKVKNLTGKKLDNPQQNFAGRHRELIYDGGEYGFIKNMITRSEKYGRQCLWFTTLVSKQSNLEAFQEMLINSRALEFKKIDMATGNKTSRIIAWTFQDKDERKKWREQRW